MQGRAAYLKWREDLKKFHSSTVAGVPTVVCDCWHAARPVAMCHCSPQFDAVFVNATAAAGFMREEGYPEESVKKVGLLNHEPLPVLLATVMCFP